MKLTALRQRLRKVGVDAYIIPTQDAHHSEYIAPCDNRREWISEFTGSAGTAVVTDERALLWTDGRYHLQATQQLSEQWTLMPQGRSGVPTIHAWLADNLKDGEVVGVYPPVTLVGDYRRLINAGVDVRTIPENLVDQVWEDRTERPIESVFVHQLKYAGKSSSEKLDQVREKMAEKGAQRLVLNALDEIAWLTNLRGSDIDYNPVFFAYAVVDDTDAYLFIDSRKLTDEVSEHLENGFNIRGYDEITDFLQEEKEIEGKIWIDASSCNQAIYESLPGHLIMEEQSPIQMLKAVKNDTEVQGMINSHVRDAVAKIKYLYWLEKTMEEGKQELDEWSAAERLEQFRSEQENFVGPSFSTISGSGPNGAIIHYHVTPETARPLSIDEMYLCDSGGQYLDGTTDVTRTVHFGEPTDFQKESFTRVLQGHIALGSAVFPKGTSGPKLDAFTRGALWKSGLDFNHGAGHGIGAFLNVHEGPHGISASIPRSIMATIPLLPGMFVSNEPGYYQEGEFGIRIESILVVEEAVTRHHFGTQPYYHFKNITYIPIQKKLIDTSLLTFEEVEYLNSFHASCWEATSPHIDSEEVLKWLEEACAPLEVSN